MEHYKTSEKKKKKQEYKRLLEKAADVFVVFEAWY